MGMLILILINLVSPGEVFHTGLSTQHTLYDGGGVTAVTTIITFIISPSSQHALGHLSV